MFLQGPGLTTAVLRCYVRLMTRIVSLGLAAAVLLLTGCGGGTGFVDSDGNQVSEEQVANIAGFTRFEDGSWTGPGGCKVNEILLGKDAVADAKGATVTNPTGTVGVAFPGAPECRAVLRDALEIVG